MFEILKWRSHDVQYETYGYEAESNIGYFMLKIKSICPGCIHDVTVSFYFIPLNDKHPQP